MTDPPDPKDRPEEHQDVGDDGPESQAMRDLLKRSLSGEALRAETPDLLPGVQKRIRRRSSGKFFGDGWSTSHARFNYVLVALVTLLLVALAFFALGPLDVR
jgi:hypothetical protein